MSMRVIAITLTVVVAMWFGVANAEDLQLDETARVPYGTYQPFGVWQKIQLGATSAVNPDVAKGVSVVNSYDWKRIATNKEAQVEILSKAKAGEVAFATKTEEGRYKTVPTSEAEQSLKTDNATDWKVLSYGRLSGQSSRERLINWRSGSLGTGALGTGALGGP